MKALVYGGAGYIGSILVPELLSEGLEVTVVDNLMYRQHGLLDVCNDEHFSFIRGDIRDIALQDDLLPNFDVVIPLAAIVGAPACDRDPLLARQVNLEAVTALSSRVSRQQMLLFPVTNSGYGVGQGEQFCTESSPLNPISIYGQTKVAAERVLLDGGNAVTFRLATVFGVSPRMRMDLLVNDFVYKAFSDRAIVLFEAHFKRNYLHVRDVAKLFKFGIAHYERLCGEPYNVGLSDANLSKLELCQKIKQHVPELSIMESEIGEDPDKRDYVVSNEKVEAAGFATQQTLDSGIDELLKAYLILQTKPFTNL